LEAEGTIPLSAHPDPKFREKHGVPTREALRKANWDNQIDWDAGKVGPYSSVLIKRASIEAWLTRRGQAATETEAPAAPSDANAQARRRGPKPRKRNQVKNRMRDDIKQGRRTRADLEKMSEKELLNAYPDCKSRHTVREARKDVVAEIVEN
jgi:hypothetical protein